MIAKYSADLPSFKEYRAPSSGAVVLLTGSTGALGSHILNSLLSTSLVIEVITLNRSGNVAERQQAAFEERGIPTELLSSPKLTSVIGDMKQRGLGLNEIQLREVCSIYLDRQILRAHWHRLFRQFYRSGNALPTSYTMLGESTSICPSARSRPTSLTCETSSTSAHHVKTQSDSCSPLLPPPCTRGM